MASRKNAPVKRVDPDFVLDMKLIAKERLDRGLAKLRPCDLSLVEMTKLLRRTDGYQLSLKELRFKPKRLQL